MSRDLPSRATPEGRSFEVGRIYSVPCLKTHRSHKWDLLFNGEWVPVIGPEHRDGEIIGFPYTHFHIDWRFASDRLFKAASRHLWDSDPGMVYNRVLHRWPIQDKKETLNDPFFTGDPVQHRRKCRRDLPAYPHQKATWLPKLREACAAMRMTNMTCPHQGLPLEGCPRDGDVVQCPGHGLRWNVKTGELVT